MKTELAARLGLEFPIFGFSHCRDVVAAITNAGGMGILGAQRFSTAELEMTLHELDEAVQGRPYGVDVLFPIGDGVQASRSELRAMIPDGHQTFVSELAKKFDVPPPNDPDDESSLAPLAEGPIATHERTRTLVDIVFEHDVPLLVSALGVTPSDIVDRAHRRGMLIGGMVGSPRHAIKHVAGGADLVIAQGTEAAGHTGAISTMVLVPQIVDAVPGTPVLAAGGIASGRQIAAALALGAEGAWLGSVWLTTVESDVDPIIKQRIIAANSRDAVQTRIHTGKPNRTLRTDWISAWQQPGAPEPLPMPLQALLQRDVMVSAWEHKIPSILNDAVGQVIGSIEGEHSCGEVVFRMVDEFIVSVQRLDHLTSDE